MTSIDILTLLLSFLTSFVLITYLVTKIKEHIFSIKMKRKQLEYEKKYGKFKTTFCGEVAND